MNSNFSTGFSLSQGGGIIITGTGESNFYMYNTTVMGYGSSGNGSFMYADNIDANIIYENCSFTLITGT